MLTATHVIQDRCGGVAGGKFARLGEGGGGGVGGKSKHVGFGAEGFAHPQFGPSRNPGWLEPEQAG